MQKLLNGKGKRNAFLILVFILLFSSLFIPEAVANMMGDINNDGKVNVQDVALMTRYVLGLESLSDSQLEVADVNGDGRVDVQDAALLTQYALGLRSDLIYEPDSNDEVSQSPDDQDDDEPEADNGTSATILPAKPLYLYAQDGTYLGKLTTSQFDSESIFNEFGSYGSPYSTTSIWNDYGRYGGEFSSQSPFNKFTRTPPYIVTADGEAVARLTVNEFVAGAISPFDIENILHELGL